MLTNKRIYLVSLNARNIGSLAIYSFLILLNIKSLGSSKTKTNLANMLSKMLLRFNSGLDKTPSMVDL